MNELMDLLSAVAVRLFGYILSTTCNYFFTHRQQYRITLLSQKIQWNRDCKVSNCKARI